MDNWEVGTGGKWYDIFSENKESQTFGNKIANIAVSNFSKTGVLPSVVVAQAVLESNYGKSDLATNYFNIFGKKGKGTNGSVNLPTWEDLGGGFRKQVNADFAVFKSLDESYNGYASNIQSVFPDALKTTDYKQYISALVDGDLKYATDSEYKQKVTDIIETYNLDALDKGLTPIPKGQTGGVGGAVIDGAKNAVGGIVDNLVKNTLPSVGWVVAGIAAGIIGVIFLFGNEGESE